MRLSSAEIAAILTIIKKYDHSATVYLFGSRIDDNKLGGDIDLLVHSQMIDKFILRKIKWDLLATLGEQKIDILLSQNLDEPFVRLILPEAILITEANYE